MDSIKVETRVKVTEEEIEALRSFYEDVSVEELESMTAEERARFADSMPESVKDILRKLSRELQKAKDRAMLKQMSRYMDEEAERLLRGARGGGR